MHNWHNPQPQVHIIREYRPTRRKKVYTAGGLQICMSVVFLVFVFYNYSSKGTFPGDWYLFYPVQLFLRSTLLLGAPMVIAGASKGNRSPACVEFMWKCTCLFWTWFILLGFSIGYPALIITITFSIGGSRVEDITSQPGLLIVLVLIPWFFDIGCFILSIVGYRQMRRDAVLNDSQPKIKCITDTQGQTNITSTYGAQRHLSDQRSTQQDPSTYEYLNLGASQSSSLYGHPYETIDQQYSRKDSLQTQKNQNKYTQNEYSPDPTRYVQHKFSQKSQMEQQHNQRGISQGQPLNVYEHLPYPQSHIEQIELKSLKNSSKMSSVTGYESVAHDYESVAPEYASVHSSYHP